MATIRDIAKIAGVSPATVSRILNQDDSLSVSPATRERVVETANQLNYRKNTSSQPERTTIGIFQWCSQFQELEDPYYQSIRVGIEKYCLEHQIDVIRVFQSDSNYTESLKSIGALICIGKFDEASIEEFKKITPFVILVDMKTSRIHCNTISLDFNQAMIDGLDYLAGLGHKKIAFLGGIEKLSDNTAYEDERKLVFENYCKLHNICYEPYIREFGFSSDEGYRMGLDLIEKGDLPTAVFAASDPIALGAMRAFYEKGYKIPEDISILGFDNISLSEFSQPPLSTIHAPAEFMGKYAAHYISLLTENRSIEFESPVRLVLPCKLVTRESCTKARDLELF